MLFPPLKCNLPSRKVAWLGKIESASLRSPSSLWPTGRQAGMDDVVDDDA